MVNPRLAKVVIRNVVAPARASKPPQECHSWCQFFAKLLKVSAKRDERPVQRYYEVFGLGAEWQDFIVVLDF